MSLDVIGAGFGRTGTLSMKAALEHLGYDPCYHMSEVVLPRRGANDGHLETWRAFACDEREMNWRSMLDAYRACVDFPTCLYYRELMEAFPDAKVVLTTRDPDAWYASWAKLWSAFDEVNDRSKIVRFHAFFEVADTLARNKVCGERMDRDTCVAAFKRHVAAVRADVPADRLLVFDVRQGWPPLCEFLDVDVPDTPFPHLNEGEGMLELFKLLFWTNDRIEIQ